MTLWLGDPPRAATANDARLCRLPTLPCATAGQNANMITTTLATQLKGVSEETERTRSRRPSLPAPRTVMPTSAQLFVHAHNERDTSLFS